MNCYHNIGSQCMHDSTLFVINFLNFREINYRLTMAEVESPIIHHRNNPLRSSSHNSFDLNIRKRLEHKTQALTIKNI